MLMTYFPIVLIDDLRSFQQDQNAVVIRTERESLTWLESLTVDDTIGELWLDHDLGEDEQGQVTSIMPFVNKLEELAFFEKAPEIEKIWIHTSNSVGGKNIELALGRFFRTRKVYAGDYFIV